MTTKFGAYIAESRKTLGLTQEQLARRLEVTVGTVASWESGRTEPRSTKMVEAAVRELLRSAKVEQTDHA